MRPAGLVAACQAVRVVAAGLHRHGTHPAAPTFALLFLPLGPAIARGPVSISQAAAGWVQESRPR